MDEEVSGTHSGLIVDWNWEKHFGRPVAKDDSIWKKYVEVASSYDSDVIGAINRSMDILLVFSGLFSAVVTTLIVQADGGLLPQDQDQVIIKALGKTFYDQLNSISHALEPSINAIHFPNYIFDRSYSVNSIFQFTGATWNKVLSGAATAVLAVYTAFLAFTTVVGIFVPSSPYQTPISNLLRRGPKIMLRHIMADLWYWIFMALLAVAGAATVFILQHKAQKSGDIRYILLLPALLLSSVPAGLRKGLRMGRKSHFIPLMGVFLLLLTAMSLALIFLPKTNTSKRLPFDYHLYVPFYLLLPFILVMIGLSHRFSSAKSQQHFPVIALLVAACGIVVAFLISELFVPHSLIITWVSMMILSTASLCKEGDIEEDTSESEALGWLITRARDTQTLHSALACIPSIANSPLRRQTVLKHSRKTLSLLINSVIDDPRHQYSLQSRIYSSEIKPTDNRSITQESRLSFYVACLAEVSGLTAGGCLDVQPFSRYITMLRGAPICPKWRWWDENWYRLLTIPPSDYSIMREYRSHHDWYSWLSPPPPDPLLVDLTTLSRHNNSYISLLSRAAVNQLYPRENRLNDITSWPFLDDTKPAPTDFRGSHAMLVELRMATTRIISTYQQGRILEASVLRYLQRYCVSVLRIWESTPLLNADRVLETTFVLAYILIEKDPHKALVAVCGDTIYIKAARCIMALKRWREKREEDAQVDASGDAQLLNMLTESLLAVTARYLQINAVAVEGIVRVIEVEKVAGVDEDSIVTGLQYLEHALFQAAAQGWCIPWIDSVVSALDALFSITVATDIKLPPLDPYYDPVPLMSHLKTRASTSMTELDRVSAIKVAGRVLNKLSSPSAAWSLAVDRIPSLPDIVTTMSWDTSLTCRAAALSVLMDTHIFHPASVRHVEIITNEGRATEADAGFDPATLDIRLNIISDRDSNLVRLYKGITKDPSPLFQAISTSYGSLDKSHIAFSVAITSSLVDSSHLNFLISDLIQRDGYPEALASIASCNDRELVPVSVRKAAIHLFARLWKLCDERNSQILEYSIAGAFLGDIATGVNLVIEERASIGLECISLWTLRLQLISDAPHRAGIVSGEDKLVKALRRALPLSDFGHPVEALRAELSVRLFRLQAGYN